MYKLNKLIFTLIILGITAIVPTVSVASIWDDDTVISPPVGVDVLPGGSTNAEDIRSSIIFSKVIPFAIDYAIKIAIALSVIALIIGGYQFMTAYGVADKHDKARKTILYAIVGLILSLAAYGIVTIVTSINLT